MAFVPHANKPLLSNRQPTVVAGRITLSAIISVLLVLGITFRIGMAGKALTGEDTVASLQATVRQTQQINTDVDLAQVQALNLFGEVSASGVSTVQTMAVNTNETALNLQLEGVALATEASRSAAIIVVGGKQNTYRVGETLPVGNQVRLESVHNDHVIVDNNGIAESLWLYDAGKTDAPRAVGSAKATTATRSAGGTGDVINRLRAQRANAPAVAATLGEIIQVTPAQANGELVGYRLSPGVKLKEFVQLGFRENDIVTSVNGIALNDMRNLPQLYSLMNEATEVSFSLLRNGQPQTLQISLTGTP